MKESYLVNKIIKAVRARYPTAYVRKLSDRFARGLPDVLIVVRCPMGQYATIFVEVKTTDGKQSKIQIAEMVEIIRSNAWHLLARDVESVMACLENNGAIQ